MPKSKNIKAFVFTSELDNTLTYFPVELIEAKSQVTMLVRTKGGEEHEISINRIFPRDRKSANMFRSLIKRQARLVQATQKFDKQIRDLWYNPDPFQQQVLEQLQAEKAAEDKKT